MHINVVDGVTIITYEHIWNEYFNEEEKFVVVLAPFRWNNCCHRLPFDPGHLCSIIRTKAYEKAASRAESGEKKAAWIE
ncbi:hypothetical protein T08_9673 [Trichinella sp. T8]|uniref:Uncharacterized protein n=1 Tax=Trichinella murrelli TaxID=144512 RepID=A0A0V0THV9_9BILA|nr:hypothetical protein T05_9993 [Trichinella murrelli]KRZ82944.1 hypothetical protein T08_9673 [Trichinella sp. T8]